METKEIERQASILPVEAQTLTIQNDAGYEVATSFLKRIKAFRREVGASFDPIIQTTNQAHKEAIGQKKKVEAPAIQAESIVKKKIADYQDKQEKIRIEEQRRLDEEARRIEAAQAEKAAKEARAAAAIAKAQGDAERAAAAKQAAETQTQQAAGLLEGTIKPETKLTPFSEVPKAEGVSISKRWYASVTDLRKLAASVGQGEVPLDCISPNMSVLNHMARNQKESMDITGVKAVSESVVGSR